MLKFSKLRHKYFLYKRLLQSPDYWRLRRKKQLYVDLRVDELARVNTFHTIASKLLKKGKKRLAENLLNSVFFNLRVRGFSHPVRTISEILINLKPKTGLRTYKRGRKTIKVPFLLQASRQYSIAARFLLLSAAARPEASVVLRLTMSIIEASKGKGSAFKRKKLHDRQSFQSISVLRTIKKKFKRYKKLIHR